MENSFRSKNSISAKVLKRTLYLSPTPWIDVKGKKRLAKEERANLETEDENENIFELETPLTKTQEDGDDDEEDSCDSQDNEDPSPEQNDDGSTFFPCRWENCDSCFSSKEEAIQHQNETHLKGVKYDCFYCKKSFTRAFKVRSHARQCSKNPKNEGKPKRLLLAEEEIRKKRTKKTRSFFISRHHT